MDRIEGKDNEGRPFRIEDGIMYRLKDGVWIPDPEPDKEETTDDK